MSGSNEPVLCQCGQVIYPTNWSMGPGWRHEDGGSLCRVFASPADREQGARVLGDYAKRIGVPLRATALLDERDALVERLAQTEAALARAGQREARVRALHEHDRGRR